MFLRFYPVNDDFTPLETITLPEDSALFFILSGSNSSREALHSLRINNIKLLVDLTFVSCSGELDPCLNDCAIVSSLTKLNPRVKGALYRIPRIPIPEYILKRPSILPPLSTLPISKNPIRLISYSIKYSIARFPILVRLFYRNSLLQINDTEFLRIFKPAFAHGNGIVYRLSVNEFPHIYIAVLVRTTYGVAKLYQCLWPENIPSSKYLLYKPLNP